MLSSESSEVHIDAGQTFFPLMVSALLQNWGFKERVDHCEIVNLFLQQVVLDKSCMFIYSLLLEIAVSHTAILII